MLGNTIMRYFSEQLEFQVIGTIRNRYALQNFNKDVRDKLVIGIDVENTDHLLKLFSTVTPDIVVNCVGLVKQLAEAKDPLAIVPINALLPHRLARICSAVGARLIHISTDCVFTGEKGMYTEEDPPDATDLYGRSKLIGEVDYPKAITLRTSLIGHELNSSHSLINWFLSQKGKVKGFRKAVFSGLPTIEISRVIRDHVIPHPELRGLYHLSVDPISKYELLRLVAETYQKNIDIIPDDTLVVDRSLDSSRFRAASGFTPKTWPEMVKAMHDFG